MKKAVCLLLACMLFALTACTPEQSAPSGDAVSNPYVEAYLAAIERENATQTNRVEPEDDVIDALTNYYEDDLKLTELLRGYISDEEVLSQVAAYDREDKINAMHHIESIYSEIEDEDCIALIKEYLVRYAICSEDEQATAFFYRALGLTDHSKDLITVNSMTPDELKQLTEHDNWVAREEKQVFPDFTVFEAEIDSEQYYKLEAVEVPGLSVFVSEKESVATVCYLDKTLDMKIMELFPEDGAAVSFELHDLTGDGIPELCYFHINGGTGACDTDLFIVDVAAMKEVQVESPAAFFEGRIGCTLLSKDERSAVYEVTCGELPPATGALYIREEEELPVLVIGEYYTLLNIQDGLLCCEVGFTMSNAEPGHHLGFARGRYAYNEATGMLEVREETEIILFNAA